MDDLASNMSNSDRANWAQAALEAFVKWSGQRETLLHDPETVLVDLLADLRHWADANEVYYEAADSRGLMHYEAECGPRPRPGSAAPGTG